MVSRRDIKIQHTDLKKEITYHNDKYHVDDAPEISDRESVSYTHLTLPTSDLV